MEGLTVRAGDTIVITATSILGQPAPTSCWSKGGKYFKPSDIVHIETTATSSTLSVKYASRKDSGEYIITASNPFGVKEETVKVKVLDVPGAPGPIECSGVSSEKVTLTWTAPTEDGGSPIKYYTLEKRETSRLLWTVLEEKVIDSGAKYHFRISAVNAKGAGEPAETKELVEIVERAAEPDLELDVELRRTLVVRAGCSIRLFVPIKGRPTPTVTWTKEGGPVPRAVIDSTESFTMLLIPESSRIDAGKYELTLENSAGKKSADIHVRVLDSPGPPLNLKPVKIDKESITLQWEMLDADIAGQPIPSMVWTKNGKEVENTMKLEVRFTELTTTLTNKDSIRLDGGEFVLTATNVGGFAKHIFNVKVLDRPGPPVGPLRVSNITADNCVLTWAPPADDGGAKIEGYVIEKRESSRLVWTNVASDLQVTQLKVTKLLKGNEYIFRVMAVNKYGLGEALESEPTIADNPYVIPDPPENPEVTAITKDSMVLMWQVPKSDGGTPITNYHIERKDRIGLRWVKCNKRKVKDLQFKATGLVVGHEYEFRITAENAAGVSAPSVSSPFYKATDGLYKPGAPCNPRILDTTKSSVTVAWNKPVYDGGSEVTGYIVETCIPSEKEEEEEWTIVTPKEGLLATSFTIVNLKENQEYKINISAVNSEGIGEAASVPDNPKAEDRLLPPEFDLDAELRKVVSLRACCSLRLFVPIRGRPAPQAKWTKGDGEVTDTTKTSVFLSWGKPVCDGGCEIQGYIVECCTTTETAEPTEEPATETEVTDAPAVEWIMCTPPTGVKKTKFEATNLKENQAYK
uniref:Titin n=1 Tax=Stegastes partitus TaxID=144197 RepID=A0A3B5ASW6_9TELE